MAERIYLDNNATTKPLPEVVEAVTRCLRERYANPSSVHQFGQGVRHAIEMARQEVADLMGASPKELVFTSGGTESINLAIRGALGIHPGRRHIVTSAVEHSAVHRVLEGLRTDGYEIQQVGVDRDGRMDVAEWERRLTDDTALATVIHANNETGVIFDVAGLASVAAERGIPIHVDAVQSAGKVAIECGNWPVQLVSVSAHKFHGPKGAGALFVRRRTRLSPIILGGNQERRLRGGTENVTGIVGMGVAARVAVRDVTGCATDVRHLRDRFERGVLERIPTARVNAARAPRLCNTSNVSFKNLQAEAILLLLSEAGICASAGAACSSGSLEPSHVLKAMEIDDCWAHGAIRFSLSRFTTEEEIDRVLGVLPVLLERLAASGSGRRRLPSEQGPAEPAA